MDNQKIQEHVQTVREALSKATPGIWWHYQNNNSVVSDHKDLIWGRKTIADCHTFDDAKLLANSPTWLQQSIEIIEQQQLEINDWEDECSALQRRYEDLDKSALETMNLLHEASHKVEQQQREIESLRMQRESLESQLQHYRGYQ
jgi:peptidoglycan hydrolase CwlO-like protein